MIKNFADTGLPETLLKALVKIGFNTPTPIQAQAVPLALAGRDVLGSAATGTGKTAAFALPLLAHLIKSPRSVALVMTPTRELATQVLATMQPLLLFNRDIASACLIGGDSMAKQMAHLRARPRLIVGTPGRINDHLLRGTLRLEAADFLVLDETDRMLDMGFGVQIEKIIQRMAPRRQTLMFSATMPSQIVKLSAKYLHKPERVVVDNAHKPAAKIKQELVHTPEAEKYNKLLAELTARQGSIIVFVKTKHGAAKLALKLTKASHGADAIHGNLQQRKRERVIQAFRDKKYRVLVATDVAARGLDIPHIEHVINYDLPQCPEDYIHRIGRTARAGAEGEACNLITPADGEKWRAIARLMNPEAEPARRPQGQRGERRDGGGESRGNRGGQRPRGRSRFGERSEGGRSEGERFGRERQSVERQGGEGQRNDRQGGERQRGERQDGGRAGGQGRRPDERRHNHSGFRARQKQNGRQRSRAA